MVEHEDEDEKFALALFHIPFADWLCHTWKGTEIDFAFVINTRFLTHETYASKDIYIDLLSYFILCFFTEIVFFILVCLENHLDIHSLLGIDKHS